MKSLASTLVSLSLLLLARPTLADAAPVCAPCDPSPEPSAAKSEGLIPGLLIGPKLSLVNLPIPAVGLELKALNLFGASFDYGFIPTVNVSDVKATARTWNAAAKVYPFRGSFFLGAAVGRRVLTAKKRDFDGQTFQSIDARLDVTTTFVAPEIGWRWVWGRGFFMGMELAWQFPLSNRVTLSPGTMSDSVRGDLEDIRDVARRGLPSLGLLQLGWFL